MTDDQTVLDALRRAAASVRRLARELGQDFKAAPAITLVLPTIRDYQATRERLLAARTCLSPLALAEMTSEKHGPEIECFMVDGVEVQLVCHEVAMTRAGEALGATEVGYVYLRGRPPLARG